MNGHAQKGRADGSSVNSAAKIREHGPAGPAEWRDGAWVRSCLCGREFKSRENWQHVPTLYDHLATVPKETIRGNA